MNEIVDTNVLIRFLVGDNPVQQKQAGQWFAEGESGKRKITIVPLIVAETVFVLESFYKKTRLEVAEALKVFLSQRWFVVEDREILIESLIFYEKGRHFVDSYLVAWTQVCHGTVLTFDKQLKKLSSV